MHLVPSTLAYLANRLLADQDRASRNAAQASAVLRQRRHEREEVDAYLQAQRGGVRRTSPMSGAPVLTPSERPVIGEDAERAVQHESRAGERASGGVVRDAR